MIESKKIQKFNIENIPQAVRKFKLKILNNSYKPIRKEN